MHVDDSLYFTSGPEYEYYVNKLAKELQHRFDVDFEVQAHWFLSMRIGRDSVGNVTLDLARYVANIVKRILGESVSVENVKRPLPSDFVATVQDCSTSATEVAALTKEYRMEYPSVIGSLIYLLNSRPDICFAVSNFAKSFAVVAASGRLGWMTSNTDLTIALMLAPFQSQDLNLLLIALYLLCSTTKSTQHCHLGPAKS